MTKEVQLPNGEIGEFPDSMEWDKIQSVLQKQFPPSVQNEQQPEMVDTKIPLLGNMPLIRSSQEATKPFVNEINKLSQRTPLDLAKDVGIGLGNAGQNVASFLTGGYAPRINMKEEFNAKNPSPFVQGMSQYLPFALGGGLVGGLAGELGSGGLYGLTQSEPGERVSGSLKNSLINLIFHGATQAANKLRPSNLFRGNLSPEELKANLQAAGDTPTGLGDVIGSPFLKRRYENFLSKLPLSNANEKFQQAGQAVEQRGRNILHNLLGDNNPENVNDQMHGALLDQFDKHHVEKTKLYDKFNDVAEKEGFKPKLTNFSNALKENESVLENLNLLNGKPLEKKLFNRVVDATGVLEKPTYKNVTSKFEVPEEKMVKNPFTGKTEIDRSTKTVTQKTKEPFYNNQPRVDLATGKSLKYEPSYSDTNILKGALIRASKIAKSSPDPHQRALANVYKNLGNALKNDVHESVSNTQHPKLINSYNQAEENYAKNYSPFFDNEIYKFINGKADPDTLSQSFLKVSKSADRSKVVSKLIDKLPEKEKGLLAYSYFSRALDNEGNFNPAKLSKLIGDLGKEQFKMIVPDPYLRKQLTNYNKLYKMNVKGVKIMENPETGQQLLDSIVPSILAHAGTALTGGALGGIPGALFGLAAPGLLSKPIVNALTSPKIRKNLVNKMLENKPINPLIAPSLETIERGVENNLKK